MKKPVANELDWLLEACFKLFPNLGNGEQAKVLKFAGRCESAPRKSTRQRARNILMFRTYAAWERTAVRPNIV